MSKKALKYIYQLAILVSLIGTMITCIIIENTRIEIDEKSIDRDSPIVINEVLTDNNGGLIDEDDGYNDWIEIYNYGDESINLEGFGLSDDMDKPYKWKFPNVIIPSKSFIVIMASGKDRIDNTEYLHTNFNINKQGDILVLTHANGNTIDTMSIPKLSENISYGRKPDGTNKYAILSLSTPGKNNNASILETVMQEKSLEPPIFSKEGGFYTDTIQLELNTKDENMKIYYTLDGSEPTLNSYLYENAIEISSRTGERNRLSNIKTSERYNSVLRTLGNDEVYKGTTVRARTYKDGILSDKIETHTYFINPHYTLPIISLVTEEDNLFGYENGIYVPGKIYDTWKANNKGIKYSYTPVPTNYNQEGKEWEREVHFEFFETNGERVINQDVGVRIAGGWSRLDCQKSLKLYAREEYDSKNTINYRIFPELNKNGSNEELSIFKKIILRNGGNAVFGKTMFKEALMQSLVQDIGIDNQAYRPSILFINGEYWGIHNIRESLDEHYIQENYGISKDEVTILTKAQTQDKMIVDIGNEDDIVDYNEIMDFINENDMSIEENYEYVKTQIDVENFMKYTIAQIYFGNTDWPQNNMKIWRKQTNLDTKSYKEGYEDGKWRWMLYDTDRGFTNYDNNTLEHAMNANYLDFINFNFIEANDKNLASIIDKEAASKNCIPLKALLQNEEFKNKFLDTFNTYLNTIFSEDVVIKKIDEMASIIRPEITEHFERWNLKETTLGKILNNIRGKDVEYTDWEKEVDKLKDFAKNRPTYLKKILDDYYEN